MAITIILVISILLQFAAAFFALRLIRVTGKRRAWVLIAAAIFLMAIRRCVTLFQAVFLGVPYATSLSAELVALVISIFMLVGVVWIAPLFLSIKQSEKELRESKEEYRSLFENVLISLWEEDLSAVKAYIDDLRGRGIGNFKDYFQNNPEDVARCVEMVKIIDVNQATLNLYQAGNKPELMRGLSQIFQEETYDVFREQLTALAEGHTKFESERLTRTLKGDDRHVYLALSLAPGYEDTWSRVLLSISDITDRKKAEEALSRAYNELEIRNAQLKEENEERVRTERYLRLEEARLDALLRLSQMSEATIDETAGFILENGITLTQSRIGFVGFLSEDEAVYTLHAVSKDVVKECNVTGAPMQWHVAGAGIWADAIRQRRTLFVNDYSKPHPSKKGFPPGHPPVSRLMVVPVSDDKRIVAVAGVGNKDSDYDKSDERQITLLLRGMWDHVQRNRSREALKEAYEELEKRVQQRTAELAASNVALKEEIIERKKAEEALKESESRLKTLIENVESAVALVDEKGQFTVVNNAFLKMFGLSDKSTIKNVNDQDWSDWQVFQEDGKLLRVDDHPVRKAAMTGRPVKNELVGVRLPSGGDLTWMLVSAEPIIRPDGSIGLIICTYQDITELKKIDKMKDEFISLVSHELRTPMTVINGSLRTAMSEGISPGDKRVLLQNAVVSAGSLSAILENMLELSRHQAGRLQLRKEPISIPVIAKRIIDTLKAGGAGQKFLADFPDDLPLVEADLVRVERILYNLLENATKYSPEESEIKVSARSDKGFVITGVADQGKGISPDDQGRLFDLFERLEEGARSTQGLGLGLVVCKRLVEAQSGHIWVESEMGKGSTFYFTLPISSKKV
jgi:PAS domain S-box-containing protein